jgi:hypothetical protein
MRALAGPAMLLVVVGGALLYRTMSREAAPSRDFTHLELAGPASDSPGTCYALDTVLIANGIFGNASRTWTKQRDDEWTLTVEQVVQAYNGPAREFIAWTFEKAGERVRLAQSEASPGLPQERTASLDQLLEAPNTRHSTPVERCLEAGATGYHFEHH